MIYILLPAFNEEEALKKLLPQVANLNIEYNAVIIDDGSTDNTYKTAEGLKNNMPITLIKHSNNKGLGKALSTGFNFIASKIGENDILITMDSDNTHPPKLIPEMIKVMESENAELIVASRYCPNSKEVDVPKIRLLTSRGAKFLLKLLFAIPNVNDYTSGYRAFKGSLIKKLIGKYGDGVIEESGFTSTFEILLKSAVFNPLIIEYPIILDYDKKPTKSKIKLIPTIARYFYLMFKLRFTGKKT